MLLWWGVALQVDVGFLPVVQEINGRQVHLGSEIQRNTPKHSSSLEKSPPVSEITHSSP